MKYTRQEIDEMQEICNEYYNQYSDEFLQAVDYENNVKWILHSLGYPSHTRDLQTGDYYLYLALDGDNLVYVGQGKGDRWKHVTSGTSHNKELNRMHFCGQNIYVHTLFDRISQEDSLKLEKLLIRLLNPVANTKDKIKNSFVRNYGSMWYAYCAEKISLENLKKEIEQ